MLTMINAELILKLLQDKVLTMSGNFTSSAATALAFLNSTRMLPLGGAAFNKLVSLVSTPISIPIPRPTSLPKPTLGVSIYQNQCDA